MTARENVHQLVDVLPEDRLADVLDYLADIGVDRQAADETLSPATEAAIGVGAR